jgi:thiol:disulfide interchange protein
MRKSSVLLFLLLFVVSLATQAQLLTPTTWKFQPSKDEVKIGETVELHFNATIQKNWYLNSNDFDEDLGPLLTEVEFIPHKSYKLVGRLIPVNPTKKYDEIWEGEVSIFKEHGKFIQKVIILEENPQIKGKIEFQSCTDVDGRCVNGKENFSFLVRATSVGLNAEEEQESKSEINEQSVPSGNGVIESLEKIDAADSETEILEQGKEPVIMGMAGGSAAETAELLRFLLLAFGAGFASIFMPCIFPIMPITVSYFTKQKNGVAKAIFYGLCIMLIFGVMGLVTMAGGPGFLNFLSTHWIPNLLFFLLFIAFGISLLGAFEIVLPHGAVNKIDQMSEKGGLVGIFFMALTLVVVSFSCTVPFVGSLLILSAEGEVWRPLMGMLAFGLPFALVFGGLAMFPEYLKKLPKSGGWLNELKAVFGFMEFALALKFLSNIDLTRHWNLIHRNVFLMIWILIAVIIALYILGFMRLPKDNKPEKISLTRSGFAVLFFAFAVYMIPGLTNKPLSLLSGILPPMPTYDVGGKLEPLVNAKMKILPHGLQGFKDYDDALAYAEEVNKPVLIDFTGYACANCRKMEEFVWPKEGVIERLRNDFVIASLYVDDKAVLPKEKQYVSGYDNELKKTVGEKNMDLEITKFNNNAQPYYVIVDPKGNKLVEPVGYVSKEEFIRFLQKGKDRF